SLSHRAGYSNTLARYGPGRDRTITIRNDHVVAEPA
ncbi:MAG: hypothetical protein QOI08_3460, partial [Actinomycetota bacterium]|nr:hypothetical protein [Actinomycetota bacterium]